jgi:hypothetical protein
MFFLATDRWFNKKRMFSLLLQVGGKQKTMFLFSLSIGRCQVKNKKREDINKRGRYITKKQRERGY